MNGTYTFSLESFGMQENSLYPVVGLSRGSSVELLPVECMEDIKKPQVVQSRNVLPILISQRATVEVVKRETSKGDHRRQRQCIAGYQDKQFLHFHYRAVDIGTTVLSHQGDKTGKIFGGGIW